SAARAAIRRRIGTRSFGWTLGLRRLGALLHGGALGCFALRGFSLRRGGGGGALPLRGAVGVAAPLHLAGGGAPGRGCAPGPGCRDHPWTEDLLRAAARPSQAAGHVRAGPAAAPEAGCCALPAVAAAPAGCRAPAEAGWARRWAPRAEAAAVGARSRDCAL